MAKPRKIKRTKRPAAEPIMTDRLWLAMGFKAIKPQYKDDSTNYCHEESQLRFSVFKGNNKYYTVRRVVGELVNHALSQYRHQVLKPLKDALRDS